MTGSRELNPGTRRIADHLRDELLEANLPDVRVLIRDGYDIALGGTAPIRRLDEVRDLISRFESVVGTGRLHSQWCIHHPEGREEEILFTRGFHLP